MPPLLASYFLDLNPEVVSFLGFHIKWYGVSYLTGFLIGGLIFWALGKKNRILLPPQHAVDAILMLVFGVVIGGRLGYILFYDPKLLITFSTSIPFWDALAIQKGGMASHGGMAGVLIACFLVARGFKQDDGTRIGRCRAFHIGDLACLGATPGLFLGRLANFINGELLGGIVAMPGQPAPWWAVKYPQELLLPQNHATPLTDAQVNTLVDIVDRVKLPNEDFGDTLARIITRIQHGSKDLAAQIEPLIAARHPSQLYQAAAEGLILGSLLWLIWSRPQRPGVITGWFLILYGILRIIVEHYWRLPDPNLKQQYILGLSRGQGLSVLMLLAGVGIVLWAIRQPGLRFSWRTPVIQGGPTL